MSTYPAASVLKPVAKLPSKALPLPAPGPLEKRGIVLGDTIGVGAYAKVKIGRYVTSKRTVRCTENVPVGVRA